LKFIFILAALPFCVSLHAAPAHYYKWRSKVDGQLFCTQTPPGPGWQKIDVPYKDARCEQPVLNPQRSKS
jgi:hypothetical protein